MTMYVGLCVCIHVRNEAYLETKPDADWEGENNEDDRKEIEEGCDAFRGTAFSASLIPNALTGQHKIFSRQ